jgi:AP-3 complex subunit mu
MSGISSLGASQSSTPALPWRRANVRHTSNELYVDLIETLSVTLAPSGRPLSAISHGTIAFTAKISGVPDLLLSLSCPSGAQHLGSIMDLPVFHPCVRLQKWRDRPGELSFVPPDGRFVLAGYEVDLLPLSSVTGNMGKGRGQDLKLPVQVEVKTSLGPSGADFEVRVLLTKIGNYSSSSSSSNSFNSSRGGHRGGLAFGSGHSGGSSAPVLDDLVITVPIPPEVKNLSDVRPSRGDISYNPGDKNLEWTIPNKETGIVTAVLRCTVVSNTENDDTESDGNGFSFDGQKDYDYDDEKQDSYKTPRVITPPTTTGESGENGKKGRDDWKVEKNKILMPNSVRASFAVRGWLPSGIKVETLQVDTKKSRGLGEGVKPYKGVKYLTVSRGGVEIRC